MASLSNTRARIIGNEEEVGICMNQLLPSDAEECQTELSVVADNH